jgi:hypothetical protein
MRASSKPALREVLQSPGATAASGNQARVEEKMSDESSTRAGAGDVPIVLDGETVKLTPNLRAAQTLSRVGGGLIELGQRVARIDVDAITTIITLGLGYGGENPPPKDLDEKIFRSGLAKLAAPCVRYLNVLGNGGRPLEEARQDSENP